MSVLVGVVLSVLVVRKAYRHKVSKRRQKYISCVKPAVLTWALDWVLLTLKHL